MAGSEICGVIQAVPLHHHLRRPACDEGAGIPDLASRHFPVKLLLPLHPRYTPAAQGRCLVNATIHTSPLPVRAPLRLWSARRLRKKDFVLGCRAAGLRAQGSYQILAFENQLG